MSTKLPFGITKTQLVMVLSLLLNLLGGTGTIQPLVGTPDPVVCPEPLPSPLPSPRPEPSAPTPPPAN